MKKEKLCAGGMCTALYSNRELLVLPIIGSGQPGMTGKEVTVPVAWGNGINGWNQLHADKNKPEDL